MESSRKKFSRYFPVSMRDRKWGWHVTTVGEVRSLPGATYPEVGHPKGYNFVWSKGRVLDCHALVYISHGRGSFESRKSVKQPIEAGQGFFFISRSLAALPARCEARLPRTWGRLCRPRGAALGENQLFHAAPPGVQAGTGGKMA